MTVFKLHAVSSVKQGKRNQDVYTYVTDDGKRGVQFHAHPTHAWSWVCLRSHQVKSAEFTSLVNAFVKQGLKQHSFPGGFNEAIATLHIRN